MWTSLTIVIASILSSQIITARPTTTGDIEQGTVDWSDWSIGESIVGKSSIGSTASSIADSSLNFIKKACEKCCKFGGEEQEEQDDDDRCGDDKSVPSTLVIEKEEEMENDFVFVESVGNELVHNTKKEI